MKCGKNVLIIEGYGRTGVRVAELLLRKSRHHIGIAGLAPRKATRTARALNWEHSGERAQGIAIDVAVKDRLKAVLDSFDLVVLPEPSSGYESQVARAALEAGTDYVIMNVDDKARQDLRSLEREVREAGLTFLFGAGLVPGALSLMGRYLATYFDPVDTFRTNGARYGQEPLSIGAPGSGTTGTVTVRCEGTMNGLPERLELTLKHRDQLHATALSALPCILGLLDGSARRPGVHTMDRLMEPEKYISDLWSLGMTVSLQGLPERWHAMNWPDTAGLEERVA